jgi:uncharacterized protein involved in exopolysaccharide biosynthesis
LDDATYEAGFDEPGGKPRRPGLPVEPRRVLRILLPHRRRLAAVFLGTTLLAAVASFFVPKTYESDAVLLYEGSPLLNPDKTPPSVRAFVKSAVLPSRLREVRAHLGWGISLKSLAARIDADVETETSMRLSAAGSTAEESRALAQAVLDVFLEHQASFNAKELERLSAENELSLERAKERRDEAQAAFDRFRERSGKPDLLDEKEQLLKRAAGLRSRADEAAVEVAAQTALIEELDRARKDLPKQIVASATKGSPVDAPLSNARSELAQARASLSEEHPRVQALKERVANLEAQRGTQRPEIGDRTLVANPARASVDEQLASARASLAAAEERKAALRVLMADVQREAESLAPSEGEARALLGELDAAVARVEALTARQAALRDAMHVPFTGFRVLSSPALPEQAKKVTAYVAFLLLLPLVVALAYGVVLLMRDLRTLRVEAPREVAWWGNGPVLGTSVWPRQPDALASFVDELEDQGVYGAGRTLVVPATEVERDIACSFAMRLAEAPWLAAAILDVGDQPANMSHLVTPPPSDFPRRLTPSPEAQTRRLSSQGTPSVSHGRAVPHNPTIQGFVPPSGVESSVPPIITPSPTPDPSPSAGQTASTRPPRKRTVIGLPAVQPSTRSEPSGPIPIEATPVPASTPPGSINDPTRRPSNGPQAFRRKRGARATVRMVVPGNQGGAARDASGEAQAPSDEEAFLLTRPVPLSTDETPGRAGRAVHMGTETPYASASDAVMRAAVRLLGDDEGDVTQLRRSEPPGLHDPRERTGVTGVALAWNGPLSGPVLRRAARLAHRVMIVVSSGLSAVELARIKRRLGRDKGVGYVLVNLEDAYLDTEDRVGPVAEFWRGDRDADSTDSSLR